MSEYILIIIWIAIMALLARILPIRHRELVCGEETERFDWLFALIVMVPLVWMASQRGNFGDTYAYIGTFRRMPTAFGEIQAYMDRINKDDWFYYSACLIKVFVTSNERLYLGLIAAFQAISIVVLFRKYSPSYLISVFLFVASTDYIAWMYNGIRQFVAVTIILYATPLMLKKKYLPSFLIILLASQFHKSALLMIPLSVIAQGKAWNWRTLLFMAGALLAVFYVDQFTTLLDDALDNTQYKNVVRDYTEWNDDGTNPIRVLVYSLPAILALIGRRFIWQEGNELINFCANMSIISMGLYLISMVTSGIFLGRLPIYTSLYSYILLPWELDNIFSEETARLLRGAMILLYLGFYYYQMHITNGLF